MIIANTMQYNAVSNAIEGSFKFVSGATAETVVLDVKIEKGTLAAVSNKSPDQNLAFKVQCPGQASFLVPVAGSTWKIVKQSPGDLNSDGVVDSADLGLALNQWADGILLGQVQAEYGGGDTLLASGSIMLAGAGTFGGNIQFPGFQVVPCTEEDMVLRFKFIVGANSTVTVTANDCNLD